MRPQRLLSYWAYKTVQDHIVIVEVQARIGRLRFAVIADLKGAD